MAGNANNIMVGAAVVSIDGTDVGYTRGGTTIRYEPTYRDSEADQAMGVVRKSRLNEKMFVVTNMLEVTLLHIRQAFNQPSGNLSGSTLLLGYSNSCTINEHTLVLVGVGPNCTPRTFTLWRAVAVGNRSIRMAREEESVLEVEFEVLKDSSGHFGLVVDT